MKEGGELVLMYLIILYYFKNDLLYYWEGVNAAASC